MCFKNIFFYEKNTLGIKINAGMLGFEFDIAAIFVCFSLWIILFSSRILPIKQNLLYRWMLILTTVSSASAIGSHFLYRMPSMNHGILFIILCFLNYAAFNLITCVYVKFIVASAKSKRDRNLIEKVIFTVPGVIVLICVPFLVYSKVWVFTAETLHDVLWDYILYVVAVFNMLFGLFYTIRKHDFFGRRIVTVVCVYTVVIFMIVAVNLIMKLMLLNFGVSLGLIFIFMTLQDPNVMRDTRSNSFNSKGFDLISKEWLSTKKSFGIIGVHIKNMSFINDKYGIEIGNKVVEQIAPLSRIIIPNSYIFHLRGTSFAVIAEKVSEGKVRDFVDTLSNKVKIRGMNIPIDVVACLMEYPKVFHDEKQLTDLVEFMMDGAYHAQKSRIIFATQEHLKKIQYDNDVLVAVKQAVQDSSYQVFYQPIMNVQTGEFETAEALARLIAPDLGFIPPDVFIQKAERSGDIVRIGEIILEKVCKMICSNKIENLGVKNVKINLSVIQCLQRGMADRVIRIIDAHEIDHELINFEITESIADNSDSIFIENVSKLKDAGFKFALDDYGTGYSNMTRMISFHFDVLKLDKSIVWMAENNSDALISMKGTVDIADRLKMAVLAEGVETEAQAKILKESGVKFFQGFLYSKPLSEYDFIEFLKNKRNVMKV